MKPRDTLSQTQADRLLSHNFFRLYLRSRLLGSRDVEISDATGIFSPAGIDALRQKLSNQALQTPVVLTERLSNRVLAIHMVLGADKRAIAINTRFRVDPDYLVHTIVEEFAHAQQVLDNVDFETERAAFAYTDRPYELAAKRIATEILGYDPADYEVYLVRDEPLDVLYDRPTETT